MTVQKKFKRPHFEPQGSDFCFCNRGKLFKDCCGSKAANRPPPAGVAIIHSFISEKICEDWVARAELKPREWMKVIDTKHNNKTGKINRIRDPGRVTEKIELEEMQAEMNAEITRALQTYVEPMYKKRIAWFEGATLLRYQPGGKYAGHADCDSWDYEGTFWYKCMDRSVSLLIYLNDDYEGGALRFGRFNYAYQPRKGDLLFFLSDHRSMHEAEVVRSGVRYAIVSWSAFSNIARVFENHKPVNWVVLDPDGV